MGQGTVHEHPGAEPPRRWHSLPPEVAAEQVDAGLEGLSSQRAKQRLASHGPNRLPMRKRESALSRLLRQFHNVLIYILIAAAVATALLELWVDATVILAVVLINGVVGFIQEGKAEKALEAIRGMLSPQATVRRDGHRQQIDAEQLVPGDLVLLQSGARVPADLRIVEAKGLRVDEAMLTGESVAVDKGVAPVDAEAELGDQSSMAFSGTLVVHGRAKGVVVATGADSQIGRISAMLSEVQELTTPLLRQVHQFGRWLAAVILVVAGGSFAFGAWVQGYPLLEAFLAAVSIAVAAIPEGLPAIMTITLAIGVRAMAERHAIIRRLPAVETLGSVTTIFSDKTGTLTRNEMTVKRVVTPEASYDVGGVGYAPDGGFEREGQDIDPEQEALLWEALRAGLLCNDAHLRRQDDRWALDGEPTEGSLVTAAVKAGFDVHDEQERFPRTDVIPFESSRQFMATLHHDHAGHAFIYVKGAPEKLLGFCRQQRQTEGDASLDRKHWQRVMEHEAGRGQRLLAIARKDCGPDTHQLALDDVLEDLTLLALVGILDPPREEAIEAVADCQRAGISIKMITGDHATTAAAIAAKLGIDPSDGAISGREVERMDDAQLRQAVQARVFARASPEHKLRLVQAAQAQGEIVAMTGDGVNDAPALKRADVGVAMGIKGTEAAKEAAEMVLTDDNFASIAQAVETGRTVYDNLRKAILFLLPTNGGQAFTIILAILLGHALPLEPVQVLWVNMVTAVTLALALAFEPTEPAVMERPPREPSAPVLSGFLVWRIGFVSVLLVAGTFGHFVWMQQTGAELSLARTTAINTLVLGQVFYLLNSRFILESSLSARSLRGNRAVAIAIGVLVVLQLLFTYAAPLQFLFGTQPIGAVEWARALGFGVAIFLLVEAEKALLQKRHGQTLR